MPIKKPTRQSRVGTLRRAGLGLNSIEAVEVEGVEPSSSANAQRSVYMLILSFNLTHNQDDKQT